MNLPAMITRGGPRETLCASTEESIPREELENKPNIILDGESIQREGEKQISVDPISLNLSISSGNGYGYIHPYPVAAGPRIEVPPPAGKTGKFMSCSIPYSASSSPRFTPKHKKKCRNQLPPPHAAHGPPLARQYSVALTNLERLRESHLRRSKSCGEGRACQPSVDFDIWSTGNNNRSDNNRNHEYAAAGCRLDQEVKAIMFSQEGNLHQDDDGDKKFKCGACMFLPGFGKGKTVKARNDDPEPNTGIPLQVPVPVPNIDVLQRVSLERFECGSWRSSAVISYEEEEDGSNSGAAADTTSANLFFDLPVELIRCSSVNDTESPVTTGFMFDQQQHSRRKGVLKNAVSNSTVASSGAGCRKSQESCRSSNSPRRHVHFLNSSPTTTACTTPRFHHKNACHRDGDDDDDLNAFLEAQSA